jgi:phenylalanyl-tRNA synthetase alpha chain
MNNSVQQALQLAEEKIQDCTTIHQLLHEIKPMFFGKDGVITQMSVQLKTATLEDKKTIGQNINILRSAIEELIKKQQQVIEDLQIEKKMCSENINATLPTSNNNGSIHLIPFVINEIFSVFEKFGFNINFGPEIEQDFYNFHALNMADGHPARQMHDTFYLNGIDANGVNGVGKDGDFLLRTHTTTIDIRQLTKHADSINRGNEFKSVSCGRVFRCDSDRTHSPMFHQIEMLCVGSNMNMGHLKYYIQKFLQDFFQTNSVKIRLRPSFFPFTAPSAEVDIVYSKRADGEIEISANGKNFLEVLGCGMLHPNVLENCGIDSSKCSAIALGMGVERMAMLKYGVADLRDFFTGNMKFIEKYSMDEIFY